jgi:lysophospholipase L1-like esterase
LGGTAATGGSKATGGLPNVVVGGAANSGGNPTTGGTKSTGGMSALGGTVATGGIKATGGAPTTGGTPSAGGTKTTGGAPTMGGTNATGGSNGGCGSPVPLDPTLLSSCTGTSPITCTLTAPNGNWDVTVELGDPAAAGSSRVSSETRHYENNETATAAGAYSSLTFTANVRAEVHDGGQSAPGNILNLLIDGSAPKLHGLGIRSAPCAITIFIASDSTVCDWVATNTSAIAPDETGWGQELSLYMKAGVSVANYADSGETAGSFYTKFFPAARTAMKAGDYLFIQFGHNDMKNATDVANYPTNLGKYVTDAKAKGAIPVIFSPVSRAGGSAADPGFDGLNQVALDTADSLGVAKIDLTTLSRAYYQTVPNFSNTLFVSGGTHFSEVGAIGVAGVVANAIKSSTLGLSSYIR